ncbi:MAG: deoxyribonuclease IV [Candidatus Thermoplasmatota archaeon]|jgi:deoxyribonuclease-4|nr:deoxyribonuclease IV [Candidatus Thermoplasmatota archaeon]
MGLLGAHVGISGGLHLSIGRARDLNLESFQIFSRNQRQWTVPPLESGEVQLFKREMEGSGLAPPIIHASYLLNICSPEASIFDRSVSMLSDELLRADILGASAVVIHPGAHMGTGLEAGLKRGAAGIKKALERYLEHPVGGRDATRPTLLLETTAGQGTGVGHTFDQLADLMELSGVREHMGICLDTCHVHASGYDISNEEGYRTMMDSLSSVIGIRSVGAVHLNDSIKGPGSRVDRHTNIGDGALGIVPFELLVNDRRFDKVPLVLETPGGDEGYRKDLITLRGLVRG